VATTGFSDVASPPRPTTRSRPAASPGRGAASVRSMTSARMMELITKPSFSSRGPAQRRIEGVAQAVAEQVEAEHGDEDRQARKRRHPPRGGQELAAFHDHVAPARQRRLGPEAQIAEP